MTYIVVGRFGKAHGIKGAVTIQSFTDPIDNIFQYLPWFVKTSQGWEEINIDSVEQRGKQLVARIEKVSTREQASALTNQEIAVDKSMLPILPEGEFYWEQLVGLSVVNVNQVKLGTVVEMMATGSNDVMVVKGERKRLIPYLMDLYVKEVDLSSEQIVVDWDENF